MFNLFQASNLMTESKDEIVATGLVLPAVDVVLWCNDQGVEIGVEVPKEWIRPMYNHGMISGPLLVNGQIVYKAETKVF